MSYPTSVPPETPREIDSSRPPEPPEKSSIWEDFIDIFYAPRQVFERRRDGKFGLALLILLGLTVAIFFGGRPLLEPVYDAMIDQMIATAAKQNPNIKPEQMQGMRGMMTVTIMSSFLIGYPVIILLTGTALWIVGKFFESRAQWSQAMMVATYANVPRLLASVLVLVLALAFGTEGMTSQFSLTMSPARFLSPDSTSLAMLTALSRLDLFTLWVTVLLGIGLHVVGRISLGKAMAAAFIVWILGGLLMVAQAAQAPS